MLRMMLQINSLYQGDCLEVMKDIDDKSIDMILCDLPYNTTDNQWDMVIPFEPLWNQYERIIKDNGNIILTAAQPFTSQLIMSNSKLFKYDLVWEKTTPAGYLNAKKQPLRIHESILVFYKKFGTYNPQGLVTCNKIIKRGENSNYSKASSTNLQSFTNYPKSILKFASEKRGHPTGKPVSLFEYLIRTYSNEGDLVLDNCAGSGTTAIACKKNKRNYILIEKEDVYCNKILNDIK